MSASCAAKGEGRGGSGEGATLTDPLRHEPRREWRLRLTGPGDIVIQLVEWIPPAGV